MAPSRKQLTTAIALLGALIACAAALARVGLDLPLDRLVGEHGSRLSGGEAQRVALARLLLREDAVVVLDEPTEHLDAPTADALVEDLLAATAGAAVLVITHDPALVARCDRVVTLRDPWLSRAVSTGDGPGRHSV